MSGMERSGDAPLQPGEIELVGRTVAEAVEVGLEELGLESVEGAEVTVLREGERGFLGFGGKEAVVRMRAKPKKRRRRRGRSSGASRRGGQGRGDGRQQSSKEAPAPGKRSRQTGAKTEKSEVQKPVARKESAGRRDGETKRDRSKASPRQERKDAKSDDAKSDDAKSDDAKSKDAKSGEAKVEIQAQAAIVDEFLTGLLGAFGLEGAVETRVEEDIIYADVTGEQTEALVGQKGACLQAVLELCRTVVQRKSQAGARLRLDIAGYAERRREALKVYAGRLADQVLEEGGEIMLEPMNPADRKAVHDVIAEIEGVRSFSEGEDPNRSVVIARHEERG